MDSRHNTLVDEYINKYPENIKIILQKLRLLVLSSDENITETMKYNMPTYVLSKNIFHFAANKNHLGVYPTPGPILAFKSELNEYKTSKGAIQFPYSKEIPYELISKIIQYQIDKFSAK